VGDPRGLPTTRPSDRVSGSSPGRRLGPPDRRWQGDSSSRSVRGWCDWQIYASPAVPEGAGRFRAGYCRFAGVVTANVILTGGRLKSDPPFRLHHGSRRLAGSPNALGIYCRGDRRHFPQIHIKPRSKDRRKALRCVNDAEADICQGRSPANITSLQNKLGCGNDL
jgi:hypothetical protein